MTDTIPSPDRRDHTTGTVPGRPTPVDPPVDPAVDPVAEPVSEPAVVDQAVDDGETFGDDRVNAAVASLAGLDRREVHEHPERYERAHEALRGALDDRTRTPVTGSGPV